jgi:hypothetical protein
LPVVFYAPLGGPVYLLERIRLPGEWGVPVIAWGGRPSTGPGCGRCR